MSTSWNYRIMRHRDGNFSLVEVVYQDDRIIEVIRNPLFSAYVLGGQDQRHIITLLKRALRDARDKPIVNETETDESVEPQKI